MPVRIEKEFQGPFAVPFCLVGFVAVSSTEALARMWSPIPTRTFLKMQAAVKELVASLFPHPVRGARALMGANLVPYRRYWMDHQAILGHVMAVANGQASERKPYQGYVHGQGPVLAQEIGQFHLAEIVVWPGLEVLPLPKHQVRRLLWDVRAAGAFNQWEKPPATDAERAILGFRERLARVCGRLHGDFRLGPGEFLWFPALMIRHGTRDLARTAKIGDWFKYFIIQHQYVPPEDLSLQYDQDFRRVFLHHIPVSVAQVQRIAAEIEGTLRFKATATTKTGTSGQDRGRFQGKPVAGNSGQGGRTTAPGAEKTSCRKRRVIDMREAKDKPKQKPDPNSS